jgi:GH18 family chitinase
MSARISIAFSVLTTLLLFSTVRSQVYWNTAFWAEWSHLLPSQTPDPNNGRVLRTSEVDWSTFGFLIHQNISVLDPTTGTLKANTNNGFTSDRIKDIVDSAHSPTHPKVPVLIGLAGEEDNNLALALNSDARRKNLVRNLMAFMDTNKYDGVCIDYEKGSHNNWGFDISTTADTSNFKAFMQMLKDSMNVRWAVWNSGVRPVLFAWFYANWPGREVFSGLMPIVHQMLIGTYDFAGDWVGYVWHSQNIRDSGLKNPLDTSKYVPSIHVYVSDWKSFIPSQYHTKLGIGTSWQPYVWTGGVMNDNEGAHEPRQHWSVSQVPPIIAHSDQYYHKLMDQYYQESYYRWHDVVETPYLEINPSGTNNDRFISFSNQRSIWALGREVIEQGIGGTYIWELGSGYRRNLSGSALKDSLLQTTKLAANPVSPSAPQNVTVVASGSNPKITWSKHNDPYINKYELFRWTTEDPYWLKIKTLTHPETTHVDNQVLISSNPSLNTKRADYKVRAFTVVPQYSSYSSVVSINYRFSAGQQLVELPESPESNLAEFALHGNFPNPFNPSTDIRFDVPELSTVRILIHDNIGREIYAFDGELSAGRHSIRWSAQDGHGRSVGSGVYFCRMVAEGIETHAAFNRVVKMIVMK